ncbi:head maturation protease [Pseudomonas phage 201phi2-1]|uniref:Uncharacterized protein n=1 Tax=Pseudomonas phage 201phi2-1 TaxID=198110 RepID=B3FJ72_BP201|nr:head maturation protease [Pseudomonas phage 201phi2-1]ABY63039.1 hypothetical protein 201phi2-1p210 [Pseudomonas phage 201phi2-1]
MEYLIDLSKKTSAYREALLRYLTGGKYQKIGCYMEYRHPTKLRSESLDDFIQRYHQTDDRNWCARATDITVVGDELVITVTPFGVWKDSVDFDERWPSARIIQFNGEVKEIVGFDLILKANHNDF